MISEQCFTLFYLIKKYKISIWTKGTLPGTILGMFQHSIGSRKTVPAKVLSKIHMKHFKILLENEGLKKIKTSNTSIKNSME